MYPLFVFSVAIEMGFDLLHPALKAAMEALTGWQPCYPRIVGCSRDYVEILGDDNGGHPMILFSLLASDANKKALVALKAIAALQLE